MECSRQQQAQKKNQKIVEARAKAEELDKKFKETSEVKLTEKLQRVEGNQKACKENLMLKLKEHVSIHNCQLIGNGTNCSCFLKV